MVIELESCPYAHNTGKRLDECCPCGVLINSLQDSPILDAVEIRITFVLLDLIAPCIAFPSSPTLLVDCTVND